jgi:hypothetical protein
MTSDLSAYGVGYPPAYQAVYGEPGNWVTTPDSLVIADAIELLGGGAVSANPLCPGAEFHLADPFDFGAPQPTSDVVANMILDGESATGRRASNRTIVLPITIQAPTRQVLDAAREYLMQVIDAEQWVMRWTPAPGAGTPLPLLFDCQRAAATVVSYSLKMNRQLVSQLTITFQAAPYGRSDVPQNVDFPSPITGHAAPPSPVTIDSYSTVTGASWAQSLTGPGPNSAHWSPGAGSPSGAGQTASYARSGIGPFDLAAGWALSAQGGGSNFVTLYAGDAASVSIGDELQIVGNFLTAQDTSFDGGTGHWASPVNCTYADTAAQAHTGANSVALTSAAAGNMSLQSCTAATVATFGMRVRAGDLIYGSGWFRAAVSARSCQIGIAFYDSNGALISTAFGAVILGASSIPDTTSGWTQAFAEASAPPNAAWAILVAQVLATGAAAEVHYIDDMILAGRGSASLQPQIFTVTSVSPPAFGYANVTVSPNPASSVVQGNVVIQVGPPQLSALSVFAGFGSSRYFANWGKRGGPVWFTFSLTDGTTVIKFSRVLKKAKAGSNSGTPVWHHISAPIPYVPGFNYRAVTGYSVGISNRAAGDLVYADAYIDSLTAAPVPVVPGAVPQRGNVVRLHGVQGTARAAASWQFQQAVLAPTLVTKAFTNPGTTMWTCPPGVTSVAAFEIGGGGSPIGFDSIGAPGGGGGGSAANGAIAVTPGVSYPVTVGRGGVPATGGPPPLFAGLDTPATASSFQGDSVTLTAPAGHNGTYVAVGAGGAAGPGGFAGGAGGLGANSGSGGGGGGGSSGGTAAPGNAGGAASGGTGGAPGAAVPGGGIGGRGGTFNLNNGFPPASGFGGAAGGSPANGFGTQGNGKPGLVQLTYLQPAQFTNIIAHRPGFDQPDSLCPFVSLNVADVPDGATEYTVPSLIPGLPARFDGTYTVVAVNFSWATPGVSRTLFATVNQYEQAGATAVPVSTPVKTFVPNADPDVSPNGIVVLGEVTLPVKKLPPENSQAFFTITLTDSNTADRFYDILLLDSQGQTVIVNGTTGYANFFVDEPVGADIGFVGGSTSDRDSAVSVTDACLSIQPLGVNPEGNQTFLVYSTAGAPSVYLTHYPRWRGGRYA